MVLYKIDRQIAGEGFWMIRAGGSHEQAFSDRMIYYFAEY